MAGRHSHPVRRRVHDILERSSVSDPVVHAVHIFLILLIVVNVTTTVLESVPSLREEYGSLFFLVEVISGVIFTVEYAARLWCAPEHTRWKHMKPWRMRLKWAIQPQSVVDLVAILPLYFAFAPWDVGALRAFLLLRLFRFFKLARYSPGLMSLRDAVYAERRALVACAVILLGTMLLAASLMNLAERDVQPDKFGTIPEAMYWAIVTLTTVGYGDVTPVTPLGRVIAGFTAVAGLIMLALPVGIIASAFSREIHRRDFVITWSMVARVPLFAELNADEIGKVMQYLRSQTCAPGEVIVRKGDEAHSMYLLASGEVEIALPGDTVRLGPGDFFGEMAVLRRRRRSGTVRAVTPCRLLVLDAEDFHRLIEANATMARHVEDVVKSRENRHSV